MTKRTFLVTVDTDIVERISAIRRGTIHEYAGYDLSQDPVSFLGIDATMKGVVLREVSLLDPEYDHLEFAVAIDPTKIDKAVFYNSQGTELVEVRLDDTFVHHDGQFVQVSRKLTRS